MNHPDWPAFLRAIVAEPGEDTPRLVAADFLEENGDPDRAAFIRLQVELAGLRASGSGQSPHAIELGRRERTFLGPLSVCPHLWAAAECPELVRMPPADRTGSSLAYLRVEGVERLTWRRGFVEAVLCPAAEWLQHGAAVRKRNPVRDVALHACSALARDEWYAHLDALRGLRAVQSDFSPVEEGVQFVRWLREWLPGTHVSPAPF